LRLSTLLFAGLLLGATLAMPSSFAAFPGIIAINHTYEAKVRLNGKVSHTQIQASDAGQAKKLVQAQFGPSVTVLSVKKVD
jgi:folate-dependent phosphoribosylglycinamide formyltransferase PurN